jgi:hypothetical protein
MPIHLQIQQRTRQYHLDRQHAPATKDIERLLNSIWQITRPRKKNDFRRRNTRPLAFHEILANHAKQVVEEGKEIVRQEARNKTTRTHHEPRTGALQHRWKPQTLLGKVADRDWRREWEKLKPTRTQVEAWRQAWGSQPHKLYTQQPRAIATALFQLRSGMIGLNSTLSNLNVPNVTPDCPCGAPKQNIRHVILDCPNLSREALIAEVGTDDIHVLLRSPATARWLIRTGILEQFSAVHELIEKSLQSSSKKKTSTDLLTTWRVS